MPLGAKDWRSGLINNHPRLFHAGGWPACEAGWRPILEKVCTRIEAILNESESFRVLQIKEKLGTLRFYWSGTMTEAARERVGEAIFLAEARSGCTCELCGAEGRLYSDSGSLRTACTEHAKGEPVAIKPGLENLHIVWKSVSGQRPIVLCRRYDRGSDTFIDVDPKSIGIEG